MLEVVWIALSVGGFIMGAAALRLFAAGATELDSRRDGHEKRIATLETRADANCENVRNQGEILAEHREALDAIESRLPKPRASRKRKGGALKAAVDAVVALDTDS